MIDEPSFVALVWGSVAVVLAVFAYEVYALATDLGWVDRRESVGDPDR